MSIRVMADNDADISAKQDAALYYFLSGYKKHSIFKDYESEMEVSRTSKQNSLRKFATQIFLITSPQHPKCKGGLSK